MTFYQLVLAAIRDIEQNGFDSVERVEGWAGKIKKQALIEMLSDEDMNKQLRQFLKDTYLKFIKYTAPKSHIGISRIKFVQSQPKLLAELDRRMYASLDLVKINKKETVDKVLQRFKGWATSIPSGGSGAVDNREVSADLRKSMVSLDSRQKRVFIDQSHKLKASLNNILAQDGGAIAVKWKSQFRSIGYNYREEHKDRNDKIYLLRDSWAKSQGLVKPNNDGYYEDITGVGEEVNCRCFAQYIYTINNLPDEMKTKKYFDKQKNKK